MEFAKSLKMPWRWWNTYWFSPTPVFNLAICRILIVGFQVIRLFSNDFWGRLLQYSTLPDFLYQPIVVLQILLFGTGYRPPFAFLGMVFWVAVVSGILGIVGLKTNLNLIVFAISNIFLQAYLYSFTDFHHSEALVMISLVVISLSPAGKVLSIDDLRQRIHVNIKRGRFETFDIKEETSIFAKWPLLLIQWIFAIVYLDSGMSKLLKGGVNWMNGYTLQYYLWQDGLKWERPFGIWFAQQHALAVLSSWVAILFEVTFPIVLIFPKLVWLYIPLGASFHGGIYLAQKAPFLKYIPSYSVFIPWSAIAKNLSIPKRLSPSPKQVEVLYDSQCPNCLRLITILCYFDWFNRLTFTDLEIRWLTRAETHPEISIQDYHQDISILLANGVTHKGFFAFREILGYMPTLWLLRIVFYIPYASNMGAKVYRFFLSKTKV